MVDKTKVLKKNKVATSPMTEKPVIRAKVVSKKNFKTKETAEGSTNPVKSKSNEGKPQNKPIEKPRSKRTRMQTNFFLNQSTVEYLNAQLKKNPIDLASDDDDDDDEVIEKQISDVDDNDINEENERIESGENELIESGESERIESGESEVDQNEGGRIETEPSEDDDSDLDEDVVFELPPPKRQRTSQTTAKRVTKAVTNAKKGAKQTNITTAAKKGSSSKNQSPVSKPTAAKMLLPKRPVVTPTKSAEKIPEEKTSKSAWKGTSKELKNLITSKEYNEEFTIVHKESASPTKTSNHPVSHTSPSAVNGILTSQEEEMVSEMKHLSKSINSGLLFVSTVWEQYQEFMQRDIELREAALIVAQREMELRSETLKLAQKEFELKAAALNSSQPVTTEVVQVADAIAEVDTHEETNKAIVSPEEIKSQEIDNSVDENEAKEYATQENDGDDNLVDVSTATENVEDETGPIDKSADENDAGEVSEESPVLL